LSPSPSSNTSVSRGYTAALISALLLSTTAILIRILTQDHHLPALLLAFWRDVMVAAVILLVLLVVKPSLLRLQAGNLGYLIGYGLVLALFNALWTLSVAINGAAISTVLVYSSAAFTALLGRWLLKESLDWIKIVSVVLTFAGCFFVSGVLDQAELNANLGGLLTGVLSGLLYAIYSLMGRFASQRGINPWTTLPYIFAFASVFLLGINVLGVGILPGAPASTVEILWQDGTLAGWAILFALAVGPTLLGFATYLISLSQLPSSVANLLMTSEPVFTSIIAYFLLAERLTPSQIGGSLLILAGVVFMRIMEGKRARLASQNEEEVLPAAD